MEKESKRRTHLEAICEASGKHLGSIWEASDGLRDHGGLEQQSWSKPFPRDPARKVSMTSDDAVPKLSRGPNKP